MKKLAIVGAGIAGLSAAIYAQRSGFDVTLFEQNNTAGGFCTGWSRKGYFFEGAVHWLTGSNPKVPTYQFWKDTGALNSGVKISLRDPFRSVDWEPEAGTCQGQASPPQSQIISFYRDIDKTAELFLSVSPEDKKQILKMAKDVKALSIIDRSVKDIRGVRIQGKKSTFRLSLKMLPALFTALRLFNTTVSEYSQRFKHPGIRWLFSTVPGNSSILNQLYMLGILNRGDGGYPEGGSLGMIGRMTETFKALGGNLLLNTKVKKVNIENSKVTGITLESGFVAADAVIVTQDIITAMDQLFDPPLREPWMLNLLKKTKPTVTTFACVGIRGKIPLSPVPIWKLDEPIRYAGINETLLGFYNYADYGSYAPQGCSAITAILKGDTYDFWKKAKEEGRYQEEKQSLANQISRALCRKYPQLEGKIDVIDIATPLTYERYTGAYHGSWMTLFFKGDKLKPYQGYSKDISGLYFAGHRIMPPGGLPMAVDTGRKAAQMVCRQFDQVFVSSPESDKKIWNP